MVEFTKIYLRAALKAFLLLSAPCFQAVAQDCKPDFTLTPVTTNNSIEWDKFPEFSLPFKIIYSGPRMGDTQSRPLKHGFSHLAAFSGPEPGSLTRSQRAVLWYGVATSSGNQPWADNALRSPWGNDTAAYRSYWDNYASTITDVDVVSLDIERMQREDRDILALKTNTQIPAQYRSLSDEAFVAAYKKDMRWWYTEAIRRMRAKGVTAQVTSYSDVPVRNTWLNITTNSWTDWTTNAARTHYLAQDDAGKPGGSFYNALDFLSPSPYYYYGYDNPIGKDYLSYLLFHVEVNAAWSDKPVIPFVWLRIHDSYDPATPMIAPFQAEATAIFPFFSGAKGLWLWENPFFPGNRQENYAPYEHFINGLYRLSQFKDMFEGDHQLVIPQPARDHMEAQNPVWRGVVKGKQIVIAAQNPYAAQGEQTNLFVSHQKWGRNITLTGREVFLCKFELTDVINGTEPHFTDAYVFPNPAANEISLLMSGIGGQTQVNFSLVNVKGQSVVNRKLIVSTGDTRITVPLPTLPAGMYFARFTTDSNTISRQVIIKQ